MKSLQHGFPLCVLGTACLFVFYIPAPGETSSDRARPAGNDAAQADGKHDFDYEIGAWKIHLKKRLHPLAGSDQWADYEGTSVTRKMWDGAANLEEFDTDGAAGHMEGLTLRLYNPESHQWSIFWANKKDGILGVPAMTGQFKNGRGEFYDQEVFEGRTIFVRFIWSDIKADSAHFEQSFSADGGKTWEVNWITDQTRVKP